MVKLFLVRHGESIEAKPEPVLSKRGEQQAKHLAKRLAQLRITKVYASSAQRALKTYEAYKKLNIGKIKKLVNKDCVICDVWNVFKTDKIVFTVNQLYQFNSKNNETDQ